MTEESNARLAYDRISALLKDQASGLDSGLNFRTNESFSHTEANSSSIREFRGATATQSIASFSLGAGFAGTRLAEKRL